jgi:hypothetical protein
MPAEREEMEPKAAATAENFDDEAKPPLRATAIDADVEGEAPLTSEMTAVVVDPGVPFELGFNETVRLGESNSDLTFEAIIQDGRCPTGGLCMWEGEGEVQFLLASGNGASRVFTLKIPGLVETPYTDNSFVEEAGFRFKLLQLEPYPEDEFPSKHSDYRALLLFEH